MEMRKLSELNYDEKVKVFHKNAYAYDYLMNSVYEDLNNDGFFDEVEEEDIIEEIQEELNKEYKETDKEYQSYKKFLIKEKLMEINFADVGYEAYSFFQDCYVDDNYTMYREEKRFFNMNDGDYQE